MFPDAYKCYLKYFKDGACSDLNATEGTIEDNGKLSFETDVAIDDYFCLKC